MEISEATQLIYLEQLIPRKPEFIAMAVNELIREWDKPSQMPPIAEILKHVDAAAFWKQNRQEEQKTKEILARDDKPPDWQSGPSQAYEMDIPNIGKLTKEKVTTEEIQQWLDEGKRKQRAHIAKLEADPKWQDMARRLGSFPGLRPLPKTQVPKDPDERQAWAHKKAIEQGWIKPKREPGSDDE